MVALPPLSPNKGFTVSTAAGACTSAEAAMAHSRRRMAEEVRFSGYCLKSNRNSGRRPDTLLLASIAPPWKKEDFWQDHPSETTTTYCIFNISL